MNDTETILAFAKCWKLGDRDDAVGIAQSYVDSNYGFLFPLLGNRSREELVRMAEGYRAENRLTDLAVCEMWIVANHKDFRIIGQIDVTLPRPNELAEALTRKEA